MRGESPPSKLEVANMIDSALDCVKRIRRDERQQQKPRQRDQKSPARALSPPGKKNMPVRLAFRPAPKKAPLSIELGPQPTNVLPTREREPPQQPLADRLQSDPYYYSAMSEPRDLVKLSKPTADVDSMSEEALVTVVNEHAASLKKFVEKNNKAIDALKSELTVLKSRQLLWLKADGPKKEDGRGGGCAFAVISSWS